MCLKSVVWKSTPLYYNLNAARLPESYPLRIWKGWKVFYYDSIEYCGLYHGGPYKPKQWYMADDSSIVYGLWSKTYSIGFHAYIKEEDAMRHQQITNNVRVVPVRLMGVKACGMDFDGPCLVADWMMFDS